MNVSKPISSQLGGVSFGLLNSEEIRSLSVQRIQNTETFDTLLHPVPGGLYDLKLGAFGDNMYDLSYSASALNFGLATHA